MTRPIPPHGTYARANGSPGYRPPCPCDPCRTIRNKRKKRNHVNRTLGRSAYTDATQARTHLKHLRTTMSWVALQTATGRDWHTLNLIVTGKRARIRHSTHHKILAVQPAAARAAGMYIDATPSIRRVRALQAIGHSCQAIAEAAQTSGSKIQLIAAGQPRMRQLLADKIARAYRELANTPGTSARSRSRAITGGWRDPQYWDDTGHIDDVTFDPDAAEARPTREQLAAHRLAEVEHLAAYGLEPEEIAPRVGISLSHTRTLVAAYHTAARATRQEPAA